MQPKIKEICETFIKELEEVLGEGNFHFLLLGSAAMNAFNYGYSDIDIIVLTKDSLSDVLIDKLLYFRQELVKKYDDEYFRLLEGIIVKKSDFLIDKNSLTVYWGTSGERIKTDIPHMSFDILSILDYGILMYGDDFRTKMSRPTDKQIRD